MSRRDLLCRAADTYAKRLRGDARKYALAYLAAIRHQGDEPDPFAFAIGQDRRAAIREVLTDACSAARGRDALLKPVARPAVGGPSQPYPRTPRAVSADRAYAVWLSRVYYAAQRQQEEAAAPAERYARGETPGKRRATPPLSGCGCARAR